MKILLFSTEEYFVKVFSEFIAKKNPRLQLDCYTEEEAAAWAAKKEQYTMLLSEEGYLKEYADAPNYIRLGMSTVFPREDRQGILNIYQKATRLLDDLEHLAAICGGEGEKTENKAKMIAFYSTEGGSGKSTIAYLTAMQSAKSRKTLYWNLEPLALTQNLYEQEFGCTMEQILLAQKDKGGAGELLYEGVLQNADGVYVLPNIKSMGDYAELDYGMISVLCGQFAGMGMEWIILDLPAGVTGFTNGVLEQSDRIFWVFTGSRTGKMKEERVRQDPYLGRYFEKSGIIRNACIEKSDGNGVTAAFPVSHTMREASLVSRVLEANAAFVEGCMAIERTVLGE